MNKKLIDSEFKIMKLIWQKKPVSAKNLSLTAGEEIGWNKNTTYTVTEKEVCRNEIQGLVKKLFNGSRKAFFSVLLENEKLSEEETSELRQMIEKRQRLWVYGADI